MAGVSCSGNFQRQEGQYLAYIHLYTRLHSRSPAETDMEEYFRVSLSEGSRERLAGSNCSWTQ